MALETNIIEFPITQGQDEGTAVQVLPVGKFSSLQNARFRKSNRIGKRNGYTSKSSLDASGVALGNGNGRLTCLGPEFCVVDDTFYRRNTVSDSWVAKPTIGVLGGSRMLWNKFPEFTPGQIIDPPVQETQEPAGGLAAYSGMTTGLGLVWTAEGRIYNGAWYICVTAMREDTGDVEFTQDILQSFAATTDTPSVQMLSMPTPDTVVVITDIFTAGNKTGIIAYTLTDLVNGFASAPGFTCSQSAANYYPTSNNKLLFAYVLTGTPLTVRVGTLDPSTGAVVQNATIATAGNKTLLSIFGQASGALCVGYFDATSVVAVVYNAAFVSTGTVNITTSVADARGPVMFAERQGVTVFKLLAAMNGISNDTFVLDFDATGAVTTVVMRQKNCVPLSQPFSIGTTEVFIWLRYVSGEGLGVASLVRIPHDQEFSGGAPSSPGVFPIQATVDDRDVPTPLAAAKAGPPFPTPLHLTSGYSALINYNRQSFVRAGSVIYQRSVMIVPVRHRSEGIRYAQSCVVPCSGRQFVAGAQPQWVDTVAAYEAGFIQAPVSIAAPNVVGGGVLPAGGAYSYTAVFVSEVGGVEERSGPALPVAVTTGGANSAVLLRWTTMELGSRRQVTCKVYRTTTNGSVFYLVGKFDASPGGDVLGYVNFLDSASTDLDIIQNEPLYINVGQELAAGNFPACSFANVGGNRLWCGGGFTGNVVQASKLFAPHLAPEFADDDAFRVTLPSECTGSAWCDSEVLFTQEGIYLVSGDGPDGSGTGFFTLSRLPFDIGCIDWRSIDSTDAGVFFQSNRGMYLLPRGFGPPISINAILDTLTTYPIITSARSSYNTQGGADNSEQVVQWTAVTDEAANSGVVITYDIAYSAFSVDTCNADYPATFQAGWQGDSVQSPGTMTVGPGGASKWHPFRVRDTSHSDGGLTIDMLTETGDIRPWGLFSHGVVNRVGMLMVLGSACTVSVVKTTDRGSRATTRSYTGIAPDYVADSDVYLDVELGNTEQRDITALRFRYFESSALEGMALIGMIIEADEKPQGFRLLKPADRIV
jgi:hypothetical protein